ncbi:glycosyltransferase family 2 protein [Vibrio alginolyticus]|uniref:glycosyltransferase family 2 protein n=1 Tax=Vibrio alginolyticus TaxID=663 RepID=UPI0037546FBD
MKFIYLVLVYNKKIINSTTLQTLLSSNVNFSSSKLIIWNNGPTSISLEIEDTIREAWQSIELIQTLDNKPLSYIYNKVIDTYSADRYVLLDDDSQLTEEYLNAVSNTQAAIAVPAIYSEGDFRSPTVRGVFNPGPYSNTDTVIAIGSGISVSQDIVQKIKSHYGDVFDSRFALYGVDTTFFLRLYHQGLSNRVQSIDGFEHSLSRLEIESKPMSHFRQVERAYDFGLVMRHYMPRSLAMFILFKKVIKFLIGRLSWVQIKIIFKAYMSGCHPRCRS